MGDLQCDRAEFIKMLQQRYGQSHSLSESIGLLIIDLRDFRRVNAVYGFELGDFVLQQTQQRLSHAGFKEGEVWRIGNDEFGLVLSSVRDPKLLSLAANKVVRVFGEPYQCKDRLIRIEPCIGIASQFVGALHAEELLVMAEANLQEAKLQNKRFLLYDPKEHIKPSDWQFESDLHKAVVNNCLQLYYQAKVDMRSQLPTHAEALARWPRPERGLTGPSDFIPLLEKNGAIVDMTKWVVHTALREMAEWPICPMVDNYSVAVNVSSFVLEDPEFYHMVKSALGIWGVDSERLTLEITEGALIQEEQSSYQNIYRLKDLGLKISIDDFGTGYSCLSYFKRIPADELKIDQSFVTHLNRDKDDEHLTRVMIDLAHRFNMTVVAEGVEDKETYLKLKDYGCDFAQGYYLARPQDHESYRQWLKEYKVSNLG